MFPQGIYSLLSNFYSGDDTSTELTYRSCDDGEQRESDLELTNLYEEKNQIVSQYEKAQPPSISVPQISEDSVKKVRSSIDALYDRPFQDTLRQENYSLRAYQAQSCVSSRKYSCLLSFEAMEIDVSPNYLPSPCLSLERKALDMRRRQHRFTKIETCSLCSFCVVVGTGPLYASTAVTTSIAYAFFPTVLAVWAARNRAIYRISRVSKDLQVSRLLNYELVKHMLKGDLDEEAIAQIFSFEDGDGWQKRIMVGKNTFTNFRHWANKAKKLELDLENTYLSINLIHRILRYMTKVRHLYLRIGPNNEGSLTEEGIRSLIANREITKINFYKGGVESRGFFFWKKRHSYKKICKVHNISSLFHKLWIIGNSEKEEQRLRNHTVRETISEEQRKEIYNKKSLEFWKAMRIHLLNSLLKIKPPIRPENLSENDIERAVELTRQFTLRADDTPISIALRLGLVE